MDSYQKIYVIQFLSISLLGLIGLLIFYYFYFDLPSIVFSITFLIEGIVCSLIFLYKKPPDKSEYLCFVIFLYIMGIVCLYFFISIPNKPYCLLLSAALWLNAGFRAYLYLRQKRIKDSGETCLET